MTVELTAPNLEAFRRGLHELGYVEGQDIAIDVRYADRSEERLPALAAELTRAEVDVLVTSSTPAIQAARQATATIPTVFATSGDPVARGFVASLARPGGNVTGLTQEGGQESAKRLDLLKQAVPTISRVAIVWNQSVADGFRQTHAAAQALGLQPLSLEVADPNDLPSVLATAVTGHADGLSVQGAVALGAHARQIVEFAGQHRLPAMYATADFVREGGLLVYTTNFPAQFHPAATFVAKILQGAKPADLPVERPTKYDFVVDVKTAQALGLTIPQSVLAHVTELIQ
jgi:putative ABC transport system substrate-binding protein